MQHNFGQLNNSNLNRNFILFSNMSILYVTYSFRYGVRTLSGFGPVVRDLIPFGNSFYMWPPGSKMDRIWRTGPWTPSYYKSEFPVV